MRRGHLIAAGVAIALVAGVAGAAWAQQRARKPVARLNYSGSIYATTSVVAVERGYFDEEGLIVNASPESSGQVALSALIGGSTDFAVGANVRPIQALARDLPIKVIALSTYGFAGYVIVPAHDTTTKSLEELKGKSLAVQVGSGTHTVWLRYLALKGIDEKASFKIRNMDTEQIPAAFESKSVEGGIAWDPFASVILDKKLGRAILGPKEIAEPLKVTYPFFVMTTDNVIRGKTETVQRFANAWVKTLKYIHENKDEVAEVMSAFFAREGLKLQPKLIRDMLGRSHFDRAAVSDADIEDTMASARIQYEQKRLRKLPDLRKAVDNSFVERAQRGR